MTPHQPFNDTIEAYYAGRQDERERFEQERSQWIELLRAVLDTPGLDEETRAGIEKAISVERGQI